MKKFLLFSLVSFSAMSMDVVEVQNHFNNFPQLEEVQLLCEENENVSLSLSAVQEEETLSEVAQANCQIDYQYFQASGPGKGKTSKVKTPKKKTKYCFSLPTSKQRAACRKSARKVRGWNSTGYTGTTDRTRGPVGPVISNPGSTKTPRASSSKKPVSKD